MGKWSIVDFPPRKGEGAGWVDLSFWTEARGQETLYGVTVSTSSCIRAIGIINLIEW